jgi:hypothetical protein
MERKRKIQIGSIATVAILILVAWLATEPFRLSEGEIPIERKTRWIEVPGDPIQFETFVGEGQTENLMWNFNESYISEITVYMIWIDDARTEQDTFVFRVTNTTGEQKMAASGNAGQVFMTTPLENNAHRHIENNKNWSIEVTCQEARDGYIFPGGFITIPDDGNVVTIRIEYEHFIEHNPDWL